jgi:hypothetical protein
MKRESWEARLSEDRSSNLGAEVMAKQPPQFKNFNELTGRLLDVPRDVVQKRIKQERERAANNPRKRGPKRKEKSKLDD